MVLTGSSIEGGFDRVGCEFSYEMSKNGRDSVGSCFHYELNEEIFYCLLIVTSFVRGFLRPYSTSSCRSLVRGIGTNL